MGFLRRKRSKRSCLSKKGRLCYKGYEYFYIVSEQGKSYLKWMRVQRPLEELAIINLNKEILDHLPQELKNKLLIQAAIRSSYRYKGPSRQFRLIDNEAIPIANTLLENQKLVKENFTLSKENLSLSEENRGLLDKNNSLNQVNRLYLDLIESYLERIGQYEREKREDVKTLMDFVGKTLEYLLRKDRIFREFMNIWRKTSEVHRKSRYRMFVALFFSLPEEKYNKVTDRIARLEEDEWIEVERKIKALKKEIQV